MKCTEKNAKIFMKQNEMKYLSYLFCMVNNMGVINLNKYRYAQLLIMLGQNDVLINHYEECGLTEVAKELKKSSEKYRKEIDANMADIVWYDEEELETIIKSCDGEWWKLGESHAMSDKYNRTVKENRGK